jgi:hypothetical protein
MTTHPTRIGVPPARRAAIEEFLQAERLAWTIVDPPGGDLAIVEAAAKAECATGTLHPGGRIPCAVALALAESCGVPGKTIGRLLNLLEIKVRDCQLGCFP